MSDGPGAKSGRSTGGNDEVLAALRKYWEHPDFRPGQREVIDALLANCDAVAVLPTGTGKSVCYQLPALLRPGVTLVISPLIALMRDQVDGLRQRGIPATFIDSTLSAKEIDQRLTDSEFGKYRLLYVAPERLSNVDFLTRCGRFTVNAVIVDEAHCVSEWGHSFRPSYLSIAEAVEHMGRPVMVALTATATPRVRSDIVSLLRLDTPEVIVTGFDRPNIEWIVVQDENKRRRVLSILKEDTGSVVLYVGTRRGAEEWDAFLQSRGVPAVHYHGGLSSGIREQVQAAWMTGEARVMVATSAFGMGIDKRDVRHVIHVDLSLSLEAYYQEAGRAGRDSLPSRATLIYAAGDERLPRALIDQSFPTPEQIAAVYGTACSLAGVAVGALPADPLDLQLSELARVAGVSTSQALQAAQLIERAGAWVTVPAGDYGYLRVNAAPDGLRALMSDDRSETIRKLANHLLRGPHVGAAGSWRRVHPGRLAKSAQLRPERLEQALEHLDMVGLVSWRAPGSIFRTMLVEPRRAHSPVRREWVKSSRRGALRRLDELRRYVHHRDCRRNYILSYFGEAARVRCDSCDNCRSLERNRNRGAVDREMMLAVIAAVRSGERDDDWGLDLPWSIDEIDDCVDWLVREGYLRVNPCADITLEITDRGEALR